MALSTNPSSLALREHLAALLIAAERHREALEHLSVILQAEPDHLEALALAARAARAIGDPRAERWQRLHDSLAMPPPATPSPSAEPPISDPTRRELGDDQIVALPRSEEISGVDWDQVLLDILRDAGYTDRVTLSDVGGMTAVKQRLELSFLAPLRNPEMRRAYGAQLRGGLLLWGPPGCGKTYLARAVAGELGARFVSIGLHQVLDMYIGNSEKQLHALFNFARKNTPCVLFFDELDAIGHTRMNLARSAGRNVVAQLLTELDGFDNSNEGLFVIGATNQPWDVDPAFRRPGRFDRNMLVLPPDQEAREAIFSGFLINAPTENIELATLAQLSDGLSGADIALVCQDALERAMSEAVAANQLQPVTMDHLRAALAHTRPSTIPWLESARNHVRYANDSGEYDELATYLRERKIR